jgi:hypothetical protein
MKCYICGDAAIKRHGRANRCEKHHRFIQMQKTAKQDGKYVPSVYEIEKLVSINMKCVDCGCLMHWIDDDNRSAGAVLQHYRDGTLGIVCLSCNTKHGFLPGDSYRDVPVGNKLCRACKTIKPLFMFGVRKDGKVPYPLSKCKLCSHEALVRWRNKNPERYKLINKKHNDLRRVKNDKTVPSV